MKIFSCANVEIKCARDGQIDYRLFLEWRNVHVNVSPKQVAERLAPAFGLAKQIVQMFLLCRGIPSAGHFQLDLAAQHDGVNRLRWIGVRQAQFEYDLRDRGQVGRLRAFDRESQVRHESCQSALLLSSVSR